MRKLNIFRRVLPLLALLVLSIGSAWAADLVVTYDFSVTSNYPSGFPTSTTNTCTTETGYVFNGNTIYFKTANSGYLYRASTGTPKVYSVFLGKNVKYDASSANTIASTAYMKIPGKVGYKISKLVVTNASNAATSKISLAVCNASYQMVISSAVASSTSEDMTFNINSTGTTLAENEAAYFCMAPTTASGKNLNVQKIVVTYTECAPAVAYTVTFDAGDNGTCSTESLAESSAGAGVTLPSCTANTGYKFLGWTATQDKTTIDAGLTAGATYKPSAATTLYAVYGALYQVTIENPTNGTLSVKCGANDVTSGDYYAVGENINIVATPASGYKFRNIQVVDGSTHTFTASNTKDWTMSDHDITIKANFDEIVYRTITWSVNGNTTAIAASIVENGENIIFPTISTNATELADVFGKKFVGWSANSTANSAADLVSGNVAASADATYYAVYADVTPGDQETATLTCSTTTVNTTYSQVNRTDDKNNTWITYSTIQKQSINSTDYYLYGLNSNSNGYRISSPEFSGNVQEVKVWIWNTSSKDARYAYLCSSTETAQPESGDLGSLEVSPSTKNQEMTFTLEDEEFTQFNIYVSAALYFGKIEVTYGSPDVYSNYTTAPTPTTLDIRLVATDGEMYYATFSSEYAWVVPDDLVVSEVSVIDDALHIESYSTSDVVPANTGVLVSALEEGTYSVDVETDPETLELAESVLGEGNMLHPASEEMTGSNKFYKLAYGNWDAKTGLGFYWGAEGGAAFEIKAGTAYLAVPTSVQAPVRFVFNNTDQATGVENVEASENSATGFQKFIEDGQVIILRDGIRYNALGQKIQ